MDFVQSISTLGLGLIISWAVLSFVQVKHTTSYFTLRPWPLDEANDNLALIGVGLASAKPKPSVMDAPAPAQPVMMAPAPQTPVAPAAPVSTDMTHIATSAPMPIAAQAPVALAPTTMMPPQLTPAPMKAADMMPAPAPMVAPSPSA